MSVRLTSSGLQGDYGRPVYTIYFNGDGTTGANYPIGSVVEFYRLTSGSVALTGRWNGIQISMRPTVYTGISSIEVGGTPIVMQRIS